MADGTVGVVEDWRAVATFWRPIVFEREYANEEAKRGGYEYLYAAAGQRRAVVSEQDLGELREEGPYRRRLGVAGEVAQMEADIRLDTIGHI